VLFDYIFLPLIIHGLYSSHQKEDVPNALRIVRRFYLSVGQVWNNAVSLSQSYRPICWKTKFVARTFSKGNLSQGLMYVSRIIGNCNEDICAIHKMFVEVVRLALVYVRFTTAWYNNPYPKFPIVNTAICYYVTEYEFSGSSLEALCS